MQFVRIAHVLIALCLSPTLLSLTPSVRAQCIFDDFDLDHLPGRASLGEVLDLETFNAGDGTKLYGAVNGSLMAYADGRWSAVAGAPPAVISLYVWDDGGGDELYMGTAATGGIWKWDGGTFTQIGTYSNSGGSGIGSVITMRMHDFDNTDSETDLLVGGNFTSIDGVTADSCAYWDGGAWHGISNVREPVAAIYSDVTGPLGSGEVMLAYLGVNGGVDSLFSNSATAGPSFIESGQTYAIERFNGFLCRGGDYGVVAPQLSVAVSGIVYDLKSWDDGTGEKLYVGGDFTHYGGIFSYRGVIVVDVGGTLHPLGEGTGVDTAGERIESFETFTEATALGESMYMAGLFDYNDSVTTYHDVVRFGCVPPDPVVVDGSWKLTKTFHLSNAIGAHYSDFDDALYVGRRNDVYGPRGLYRIDMDGTLSSIWISDDVASVEIDDAGNIYTSDDGSGQVYRVDQGTTTRSVWASGWHSGDDDPVGLAIAPSDASGWFSPGDAFMVDRGINGPDEIWRWSVNAAQGATVVHTDDGTMVNPLDLAISSTKLWACDPRDAEPGTIYSVQSDGSLVPLPLSAPIESAYGIDYNIARDRLFVLDGSDGSHSVLSVNPLTGDVTTSITGFAFVGLNQWAGLDTDADGQRLYVTDGAAGRIYEFTSTLPCPPGDVTGNHYASESDRQIIQANAGCDDSVSCDCAGDTNGDCQTTLSDIGVLMLNWNVQCPDSNQPTGSTMTVSVDVYPTPWLESPPDGGVYYTIDLVVDPSNGDEWIGAEAAASIIGNGTFWDDPNGSDHYEPDLWGDPGFMNLLYDSYYTIPQNPFVVYPYFFTPPVNLAQQRDCTWYHQVNDLTDGPYRIARYTVRLDDAEAANNLTLTTIDTGAAYITLTGSTMTRHGGGELTPFSLTIYSAVGCASDLNGDLIVDPGDIIQFHSSYGFDNGGDIDGDGDTDRDDLALFMAGWACPNEPMIMGGPVSHDVVGVDNTSGNSDPIETGFDGGVTHFTLDLQINMGDDFWTTSNCTATLTEPGFEFFQHSNGSLIPPTDGSVSVWPAIAFDTFYTTPNLLTLPGPSITFIDTFALSSTTLEATWYAPAVPLQSGTIERITIMAPAPVDGIEAVPAGTAGPHDLVIGSITGDSTVASTGAMRYAFDYDIVVTNLPCPADLTGAGNMPDGNVDVSDLFRLLANWNTNGQGADLAPPNDVVNVSDLFALLAAWGACP